MKKNITPALVTSFIAGPLLTGLVVGFMIHTLFTDDSLELASIVIGMMVCVLLVVLVLEVIMCASVYRRRKAGLTISITFSPLWVLFLSLFAAQTKNGLLNMAIGSAALLFSGYLIFVHTREIKAALARERAKRSAR